MNIYYRTCACFIVQLMSWLLKLHYCEKIVPRLRWCSYHGKTRQCLILSLLVLRIYKTSSSSTSRSNFRVKLNLIETRDYKEILQIMFQYIKKDSNESEILCFIQFYTLNPSLLVLSWQASLKWFIFDVKRQEIKVFHLKLKFLPHLIQKFPSLFNSW